MGAHCCRVLPPIPPPVPAATPNQGVTRPVVRAGVGILHQRPELFPLHIAVIEAQMHPVHEDVRQCDDGNAYGTEPEDVPEKDADQHPGQKTGKYRPDEGEQYRGKFQSTGLLLPQPALRIIVFNHLYFPLSGWLPFWPPFQMSSWSLYWCRGHGRLLGYNYGTINGAVIGHIRLLVRLHIENAHSS